MSAMARAMAEMAQTAAGQGDALRLQLLPRFGAGLEAPKYLDGKLAGGEFAA